MMAQIRVARMAEISDFGVMMRQSCKRLHA
jgi:hypothetical protein